MASSQLKKSDVLLPCFICPEHEIKYFALLNSHCGEAILSFVYSHLSNMDSVANFKKRGFASYFSSIFSQPLLFFRSWLAGGQKFKMIENIKITPMTLTNLGSNYLFLSDLSLV